MSDSAQGTRMFQEAAGGGAAVREQLRLDGDAMAQIGVALRKLAPRVVITSARGSSDHAATYGKYLIETHTRALVSSAAPSISSVYGVAPDLAGCLFVAISQSGRSLDLLATVKSAATAGATVVALCNNANAPLVDAAHFFIPLRAGPEHSVAATKSYIATLAALLRLVAAWTDDAILNQRIESLPALLDRAWTLDWTGALPLLARVNHLYVIGRGMGLGLAQEVALKCKETCALHAEAFSSAELRHGPLTLLGPDFPAWVFAQSDATRSGVEELVADLARLGLPVIAVGTGVEGVVEAGGVVLPTIECEPELAPIVFAPSVYRLLASLALRRGLDPDQPPRLSKVTVTV